MTTGANQRAVMTFLADEGASSAEAISKATGVEMRHIYSVLASLVARGHVQRGGLSPRVGSRGLQPRTYAITTDGIAFVDEREAST